MKNLFSFKVFNFFLFFHFFFTLSPKSTLYGAWTEEEKVHNDSFSSEIKDPFVLTLKTYSQRPAFVLPRNRKTKIRKHFISSPFFKDGKIPYLLGEVKGDKRPRPLAVFMPGTFSKLFSQITKDFHLRLVRLGYRVISFENLFYHEAIQRGPLFNVFDSKKQAKAYYDAAKKIHKDLFAEGKVSNKVTLLGQSYGGFLASVMFGLEALQSQSQNDHFFNGGLHIYSPPFNFVRSIELFDEILFKAQKNKTFGSLPKYIATHFKISRIDNEFEISEELRGMALPLFADYGFKSYMVQTLETLEKLRGEDVFPKNKKKRREFFKNISFKEAFNLVDSKAFKNFQNSEEKYLSFWIKKALKKGRDDIKILSSLDDMINDEIDPDLADGPYMMTIPHGGHFGYRQMPWFDELLIKSFSLDSPTNLDDFNLALFQIQEDQ